MVSLHLQKKRLSDCLNLDNWDRETEVGQIVAPVGYGKTYAAVKTLPDMLGLNREDCLLIVSRSAIREQTIRDYGEFAANYEDVYGYALCEERKMSVTTYHKLGRDYRESGFVPKVKLVIMDEYHCALSETNFAEDLSYFNLLLQEYVNDPGATVVSMTATNLFERAFVNDVKFPELGKYLSGFSYGIKAKSIVSEELEPLNKASVVCVEQKASLEMVLRACPASDDRKQLIFTSGTIERLIGLAESDEKATWFCSEGNKNAGKMCGEYLAEFKRGKFPEGINRVFCSSAYREGLNVSDESVREVIVEGSSEIEVVQAFGRVRHDTERLIVVVDGRKVKSVNRKSGDAIRLLKDASEESLSAYHEMQEKQRDESFEGNRVPILVYEDKGELRFNYLNLAYLAYCFWSCKCARQADGGDGFQCLGLPKPSRDDYFKLVLGGYTDGGIEFNTIPRIPGKTVKEKNDEIVRSFDFSKWEGREVYGDEADRFVQEICLRTERKYSVMALSGIYKSYPHLFEYKKQKRVDGKQPTVYKFRSGLVKR